MIKMINNFGLARIKDKSKPQNRINQVGGNPIMALDNNQEIFLVTSAISNSYN